MTPVAACRTCGTEPLENAWFCDACGSLIAPAIEHAKYKQVTVLGALQRHDDSRHNAIRAVHVLDAVAHSCHHARRQTDRHGIADSGLSADVSINGGREQ